MHASRCTTTDLLQLRQYKSNGLVSLLDVHIFSQHGLHSTTFVSQWTWIFQRSCLLANHNYAEAAIAGGKRWSSSASPRTSPAARSPAARAARSPAAARSLAAASAARSLPPSLSRSRHPCPCARTLGNSARTPTPCPCSHPGRHAEPDETHAAHNFASILTQRWTCLACCRLCL